MKVLKKGRFTICNPDFTSVAECHAVEMRPMNDKIFIDTNLWVYLFSDEVDKRDSVCKLVRENFKLIYISSQVLGELFNILTKKGITDLEKAQRKKQGARQKKSFLCSRKKLGF